MQHYVVRGVQRDDHARVLAPLRLVDRAGVGGDQLVERAEVVGHLAAVDRHLHDLVDLVNGAHPADVAVEHLQIVVVPHLHHLVPHPQAVPAAGHRRPLGVEQVAQHGVQAVGAEGAPVHGGEHLELLDRIEAEPPGDALGHDLGDGLDDRLRLRALDEEEVPLAVHRLQDGHHPLVHPVGVDHDQAALGLAEDLGQPHHLHRLRADQVGEHPSGADRGELVHVPHQDQPAVVRHRPQHVVGEHRVEHRSLVHDQQVAGERVLAVAVELPGLRIEFQQPVEGGGLGPRGLGQALGGAAGGGGEEHLLALLLQDLHDAAHQRRLAGARAAGDDAHPVVERSADCRPLFAGQAALRLLGDAHAPRR